MTLSQALNEFLVYKKLSGLGKNSICNYRATLSLMLNYLSWDLSIEALSYESVCEYHMTVIDSNISRATKSSYIRNDKIFLKWIDTEYGLSFDPRKIKVPKSPKKNVHLYTNSELMEIFQLISANEAWIVARNRVVIALMLDSGLRQHEVCGLLMQNIDRERNILKITGKGAKDRFVPLGQLTLLLLDEYFALCPYNDDVHVFFNRRGEVLSGNAVRLFVYRLQKNLSFDLSSHKLRHNFATNYCIDHLEQNGKSDVYDLSIIMGHESMETTKKYEHFAHEIVATKNSISHLDMCFGEYLTDASKSS